MKQGIFTIIGVILWIPLFALTAIDNSHQDEIFEKLVENQRWDEVLYEAHLKLMEDPDEVEGYYYTALAYFKLDKKSKAKPYLKYAKRLNNKDLKFKIEALEYEMGLRKTPPLIQDLPDIKSENSQIKKNNRFYFVYDYHNTMPLGISLGNLRHIGVGSYMVIRSNSEMFSITNGFEVRSSGRPFESEAGFEHTGLTRKGMVEGIMGLTWKIKGPLWMYSGAGLNHSRIFFEMENPKENPGLKQWAKSPQTNNNSFALESGMILEFKGLNLKLGAVMTDFNYNDIRLQLGVGFSLKQ